MPSPEKFSLGTTENLGGGRVANGSHWTTFDQCPDKVVAAARLLDIISFPYFLTDNHTQHQFILVSERFKEDQIIFLDDTGEKVLAVGFSAPLHLAESLPENGWEGGMNQIISDDQEGKKPNALMAFSASISADAKGQRMGDKILIAFMQRAKELGLEKLIAPARPTNKGKYLDMPMEEYANLLDEKTGKHLDPWIRAHQRNGGKIMGVGRNSHVVCASSGAWPSVAQWEKWTGMKFTEDGEYEIPQGNARLHIHDGVGEYREDCIWMEYDLNQNTEEPVSLTKEV